VRAVVLGTKQQPRRYDSAVACEGARNDRDPHDGFGAKCRAGRHAWIAKCAIWIVFGRFLRAFCHAFLEVDLHQVWCNRMRRRLCASPPFAIRSEGWGAELFSTQNLNEAASHSQVPNGEAPPPHRRRLSLGTPDPGAPIATLAAPMPSAWGPPMEFESERLGGESRGFSSRGLDFNCDWGVIPVWEGR
jgi:hypothetical protein